MGGFFMAEILRNGHLTDVIVQGCSRRLFRLPTNGEVVIAYPKRQGTAMAIIDTVQSDPHDGGHGRLEMVVRKKIGQGSTAQADFERHYFILRGNINAPSHKDRQPGNVQPDRLPGVLMLHQIANSDMVQLDSSPLGSTEYPDPQTLLTDPRDVDAIIAALNRCRPRHPIQTISFQNDLSAAQLITQARATTLSGINGLIDRYKRYQSD